MSDIVIAALVIGGLLSAILVGSAAGLLWAMRKRGGRS